MSKIYKMSIEYKLRCFILQDSSSLLFILTVSARHRLPHVSIPVRQRQRGMSEGCTVGVWQFYCPVLDIMQLLNRNTEAVIQADLTSDWQTWRIIPSDALCLLWGGWLFSFLGLIEVGAVFFWNVVTDLWGFLRAVNSDIVVKSRHLSESHLNEGVKLPKKGLFCMWMIC